MIEAGKKGTWPGGSRWTLPFMRLNSDNALSGHFVEKAEREAGGMWDLDYLRKLADEVPDTVEFMQNHGVKLTHRDEKNAALEFEEQHYAYPMGGGKEIIDNYLIRIERYDTADVFYGHEATGLTLDDRLAPSLATATACLLAGARIIRMHAVGPAVAATRMVETILGLTPPAYLRHNLE